MNHSTTSCQLPVSSLYVEMKPGQESVCVPSVNYRFSKGKALEASLREKRMVNTGTQCGKQALSSTGSNHQRRPRRSLSDVGVTGSTYWHICLLNISTDSVCLCTHVTSGMTHRVLLHIWIFFFFFKSPSARLLCRFRIRKQPIIHSFNMLFNLYLSR